uniref:PB1-like domain-containing protein n=1 Tax=Oryza barthii TaxID=65489 RepID=A0A0D3FRX6_9ORYZ
MEGDLIRIKMHHGGSFSKEGELCYVGGQVSIFRNCDSERLSYFCLVDMAKDVGFNAGDELFYAIPGYNLENGIDKLHDDHSVRKMLSYTKKSKSAKLYIKHLEQGVSATPRFGQDVADNHGEESREGAGPLFMKPMLHFDKLCEIYASDLAKGGNAKGPGDQQRVEGFVAVDDDDDPVNHVVDKANAQKHGNENPTAPKGRKRVFADVDSLETSFCNVSNSFAKFLEAEKDNGIQLAMMNRFDVQEDTKKTKLFDAIKKLPNFSIEEVVMAVRTIGRDAGNIDLFLAMSPDYQVVFVHQELAEAAKRN